MTKFTKALTSKPSPAGVFIALMMTASVIAYLGFWGSGKTYHHALTSFGIDSGVFLAYQVMFASLYLVGYKHLNNGFIIALPILALTAYLQEWMNMIAVFLHEMIDGQWTGIDMQSVPFDKQQIFVNIIFFSVMYLASCQISPTRKSWDRTLLLIVSSASIVVVIVYHVILYGTLLTPFRADLAGDIETIKHETPSETSHAPCFSGFLFDCYTLSPDDAFPENPEFFANPRIQEAKQRHAEGGDSDLSLDFISTDETYRSMLLSNGFYSSSNDKGVVFYSTAESAVVVSMANGIGVVMTVFIGFWLYGGLFLMTFHNALRRQS